VYVTETNLKLTKILHIEKNLASVATESAMATS